MDSQFHNNLGQPIGHPVPNWKPVPPPPNTPMVGDYCRLEILKEAHVQHLFEAFARDEDGRDWTYSPYGPFETLESFGAWAERMRRAGDTQFYSVIDYRSDVPRGIAAYMSFKASHGSIELGHIHYSTAMQRTTAGSEAIIMMMRRIFSLGYRRLEWRCHALNERSRHAAERLGFTLEGIFRNSSVQRGNNRDTAWYSIIHQEWPEIDATFRTWLSAPENSDGTKPLRLSELMAQRRPHGSAGLG